MGPSNSPSAARPGPACRPQPRASSNTVLSPPTAARELCTGYLNRMSVQYSNRALQTFRDNWERKINEPRNF